MDTSVAGVAQARWGVRPEPASERFAEPDWSYEEIAPRACPRCGGRLHCLRKPYESGGKQFRYVALVCPECPATFTLADLGVKKYEQLGGSPSPRSVSTQAVSTQAIASRASRDPAAGGAGPVPSPEGVPGGRAGSPTGVRAGRNALPVTAADTAARTTVAAAGATVADVAEARWGVRPEPASERFESPGWWYEEPTPLACPACAGELHALRKLYDGPNRKPGEKPGFLVAVVCPRCPATYTLRSLGKRSYAALMDREEKAGNPPASRVDASVPAKGRAARLAGTSAPWAQDCDAAPGELRIRTIPASQVADYVPHLLGQPDARIIAGGATGTPGTMPPERRLLHWCKITDPDAPVPAQPAGVDVRVLLPLAPEFEGLCERLRSADVPFRRVRYWLEAETISTVGTAGELAPLRATAELAPITNPARHQPGSAFDARAYAARDAFDMVWQTYAQPHHPGWEPVEAARLVPLEWLRFLQHPTLNPAQAEAAPHVLGTKRHLVVTAPTGAGKTMIGMLSALGAILGEKRRKAAWLVPQRSLTDELDRDLAAWRRSGLRIERLSGEYVVDVDKVREADLWVATTEKFEAVCRASSLRAALAEVGCLVVDEIHLLGSANRGPLLEALLARVRGDDSPVRIVGLSATVSNADEVTDWLGAHLVATTWRPSRLTWQLPMIPASSDRKADQANRTQLTTAITTMITNDGGSVLVFCGSKRNVRVTALAIAASRGANTRGMDPDDLSRLYRACASVRVGLHYKDWEHKREAEQLFRDRELDVLVATTTVAAGVNLPARAVVVRDTRVGLDKIDVATVQQMFGRAGRIGAGETEGWAYLITDEAERATWQARLVAGNTVVSRILDTLPDHVLADVVQRRIHTMADAENWWLQTLAHYQGAGDVALVREAVDLLVQDGYLTATARPGDTAVLAATELGMLTTRFMVSVITGSALRGYFDKEPAPHEADHAERTVGYAIGTIVPELASAPVNDELQPQVARLLRARGRPDQLTSAPPPSGLAPPTACDPGDLAQVAFALVGNSPRAFVRPGRAVAGLPVTILAPILDEAPRYFAWLAAQGHLGSVHPWVAVVAGDLGLRIRWRRLGPPRGSGRLLWMCEQMATPAHADRAVSLLFTAARNRDIAAPDWPVGRPPRDCRLDDSGYLALLRDRATDITITDRPSHIDVTCPHGATAVTWTDSTYVVLSRDSKHRTPYPKAQGDHARPDNRGATVFTRRGDYRSIGWLAAYNSM